MIAICILCCFLRSSLHLTVSSSSLVQYVLKKWTGPSCIQISQPLTCLRKIPLESNLQTLDADMGAF